MSLDEYKLSCELIGHSLDVRAVAEGKNCLVSGSRDKTAKIWEREGDNFRENLTLQDHKHYISSVCILDDGEWICTGSNDATICVYVIGNIIPFTVLRDHTSTVCALAAGLETGTILSGSWDNTARINKINGFGHSASVCLKGHEAAVWAVTTLKKGQYVTGSADKTIAFWNTKGERLKVLKGHQDCVRCLIGMPDNTLISCANDAVIKYWNDDGECIKELHGHSNYIYCIALNLFVGPNILVSGGEDSTIRMWNLLEGQLGSEIKLPAQSVWSVTCLKNGDIATGTNDGVVRIFSKDPSRVASEEVQAAFKAAVNTRAIEENMKLGGMNVNDLPGAESLLQPGTEGQTKIVRNPTGKILCYQWTKGEWQMIGDVTGASGGTQDSSGKVLFEGKEYDYVFNVDLSDTEAAIKLPYNKGEDPWMVAQQFIYKHQLPQVYLEQIANFVIKNSSGATSNISSATSGFQDPFTGESRYVPGGSIANNGTNLVDPFTGASSYRTPQPNCESNLKKPKLVSGIKHFPWNQYLLLETCDTSKVLSKLKEFNESIDDGKLKVPNNDLDKLISLTTPENTLDTTAIEIQQKILGWPKDKLFPVLDIARLAVRNEAICAKLLSASIFTQLQVNLQSLAPNQLMTVRLFANMMVHEWGRSLVETEYKNIIDCLSKIRKGSNNLQIAIATFYLNASICQLNLANQGICQMITEGLLSLLSWSNDLETHYRGYQALGNITCTPFSAIASAMIISVDIVVDKLRENMSASMPNGFEKLNELARDLTAAL